MEDQSNDQQSQVMGLSDFVSIEVRDDEFDSSLPIGSSEHVDHEISEQPSMIEFPNLDIKNEKIQPKAKTPHLEKSERRVTHYKDDPNLKIATLSKSFEHHNTLDISVDDQQKEWAKTRKQVFCIICQLGLSHNQIIQALKYIENSPFKTDHELLQDTLDYIVQDSPYPPPPQQKKRSSLVAPDLDKGSLQIVEIEKVTCTICYDDYEAVQIKNPLDCGHKFCQQCYIEYFANKISTNDLLEVKCPNDDCQVIFTDEKVKTLLPKEKFDQYATFKKIKILNSNPNLRWCMKFGCGKYVVGEEDSKFVVCECGTKICFTCRNEYHPNQNCDDMLDAAYKDYLKSKDVQRCPKCKFGVEKIDGCNHMTCCMCNYQWCWLCRGKYSRNHFNKMNPFGCSGLQSGYNTRNKWPTWKIYIWRFFKIMLFLLLVVLLPIIWVLASLLLAMEIRYPFCQKRSRYGRRRRERNRCLGLIIGIIFLPIFMAITLVYGIMVFIKEVRRFFR